MAQGRGPRCPSVEIKFREYLSQRCTLAGEFVIAESARLIGIIDDCNLPPSLCERLIMRQKRQCAIQPPVGLKVVAHLLLQCRKHGLYLRIRKAGRGIDDGNDWQRHRSSKLKLW